MNDKEICFIMCTNNQEYMEEVLFYINHLAVPEGYEISFLAVEDAKSMTAGYNEGMRASQAKYKVYLHQDTFIVYPDFLIEMIRLFQENPQIGLLGTIGIPKMPESGIMWDGERYGCVYDSHIYETVMKGTPVKGNKSYMEAEAVDGLLMMTQYDLPWREDLFDKWDFYDASQCMEFIRKGYKVAVPKTEKPWVVHDCGLLNMNDYDDEREKFVKEYLRNCVILTT